MSKSAISSKEIRWPTPQDYNEAVQNLHVNVSDEELQSGTVSIDALGIPRPITGAFASVYRVDCRARAWALRCFLRNIPDVQWRYERISEFVQSDSLTLLAFVICGMCCDHPGAMRTDDPNCALLLGRQRRLVEYGKVAIGRITGIHSGGQSVYIEYEPTEGDRRTGRMEIKQSLGKDTHVGDVVAVLYDDKPGCKQHMGCGSVLYKYAYYQ